MVVVGAGFAGLYMIYLARRRGLSVQCYEMGEGVGSTWYWNRYPGARVDIECVEYSYSFSKELEQEWDWSERYAGQPEIERYANHVADRFDLRRDIRFKTRITRATFDEMSQRWRVCTDSDETLLARFASWQRGSFLPLLNPGSRVWRALPASSISPAAGPAMSQTSKVNGLLSSARAPQAYR